jgi:hypothetical protein
MEKNSPTLGTSSSYVASTLSEVSKLFVVNYMPNTPVGSLDVNTSKLIKLKGNLALPRKPSHPRGLLRGASPPPPEKWPHFFRKKSQVRQLRLDIKALGKFRQRASTQAGKMRESEIAYASSRIRPFSLASGLAGRSCNRKLSTSDLPKSTKRAAERCDKRNKKLYLYLQKCLKVNNCTLHGYKARMLTFKKKRARRPVVFRLEGHRRRERPGIRSP